MTSRKASIRPSDSERVLGDSGMTSPSPANLVERLKEPSLVERLKSHAAGELEKAARQRSWMSVDARPEVWETLQAFELLARDLNEAADALTTLQAERDDFKRHSGMIESIAAFHMADSRRMLPCDAAHPNGRDAAEMAIAYMTALETRAEAAERERDEAQGDRDEYRELLHDLVMLDAEEWATGGGPGYIERYEKAWRLARERFEP